MTEIGWAQNPDGSAGESWNPVTGCTKVSRGCKHCYAEGIAKRYWGARKFSDVRTHPERLSVPLHWRKPRRVFVNSMSDLFHDLVPFEFIDDVFAVMGACPAHTFIILTKRPQRALDWQAGLMGRKARELQLYAPTNAPQVHAAHGAWPMRNVWFGVSAEDQAAHDERVPLLRKFDAAVRVISFEPLLGPIKAELTGVHWAIAGGESQPGCTPMELDWARGLRDQSANAGVTFFLKQLGGNPNSRAGSLAILDNRLHVSWPVAGADMQTPAELPAASAQMPLLRG